MSIQIKYNYLEQAYPDMLEGIGILIQKAKLSGRFDIIQLSGEDIEQLRKAKELCELKIIELWDNKEQENSTVFKVLCSTYFDIASQLPILQDSELFIYEQFKLITFGYLGEHWHFVKQYLKTNCVTLDAIQPDETWNNRILTISFKAIVHLIKKETFLKKMGANIKQLVKN